MAHSEPHRPDNNAAGPGATPGAAALLLSGARLTDGRTVDVRIRGHHIEAVAAAGTLTAHGTRLDLRGYLLLPAPAEPHAHSDTALTADSPGPAPHSVEDIRRRTTEAALIQLSQGATALRSHVRIGDGQGLAALEAVLQARRSLRGLTEIVAVAVPGVLTGTAGAGEPRHAPRRHGHGCGCHRRPPRPGPRPGRLHRNGPGHRRRERPPRRPPHRR